MDNRSHVRLASAKNNDDTTRARYVKVRGADRTVKRPAMQTWFPDMRHEVLRFGRSIFHRKGVKRPADLKRVLVSGHGNVKIGRDVRKGHLKGYWIFTLSLEERATCPRSCLHWQDCYGNGMPYAKRVDHRDPLALEQAIERDLIEELGKRGRKGILVRLHALGDFFDERYVEFWGNMLAKYDRLSVYGYTARRPDDQIGAEIMTQKRTWGRRFAIWWSDGGFESDSTVSIRAGAEAPVGAFKCPEQTGEVIGCDHCGICWSSTSQNVAFTDH